MEIKTRYNVGDKVYFEVGNTIRHQPIDRVETWSHNEGTGVYYHFNPLDADDSDAKDYLKDSGTSEEHVFGTFAELMEKIKQRIMEIDRDGKEINP